MATLKEQALNGYVRIPYWQSISNKGNIVTAEEPLKTSKWKTTLSNIWAGLSGKKQLTTKDFGNNDPYNDGSDFHDGSGRFVADMETIQRFHLGNEHGSAANSQVFIDGFEDPTHLTFKVEFGEWGAAISDNETIAAIQRSSMSTNALFMDYDCFPMGLLDLNFKIPTLLKFNEQTLYNAYNWLSSRNEDRRALYIRDFIWGIYDVQRSMPYIFNKISGIDKLTDLDSTRGQRLKDVILTLTCIPDGIDLKMRTLMELYRKAAWNDIYQRWELPDIYRYFKMIIYIFDDRSLHMGGGLFSPDQDAFPIIALECGPCEFVIKNHNMQEYTLNYQEVKDNEISIDIKVLNVKTLESNLMFKNVKYINDIITETEHLAQADSNATRVNGLSINWKYVWLQRQFMMPDEYSAFYRPTEEWNANQHYFADENDDALFPLNYATIEVPDNSWHIATVMDRSYVIDSWSSLWNAVKSIVTSNTTLVRDSRQSDRYYFRNDLNYLNPDTFQYYAKQNFIDIDIDAVKRDMKLYIKKLIKLLKKYKMSYDKTHFLKTVDSSIILNIDKADEELYLIDLNLHKTETLMDSSLYSFEIPSMIFNDIDVNNDKVEQDLSSLILNLVLIKQKLTKIEPNLEQIEEELIPISINLDLATQELTSILKNLDILKLNLFKINKNLIKPDMDMEEIEKNLEQLKQSLATLLINLEMPNTDMQEIDINADKLKQLLQSILINIFKLAEDMIIIDKKLDKPESELFLIKLNLMKISQSLIDILINKDKKVQEYMSINKNLDKDDELLNDIIKTLDKPEKDLVTISANIEKKEQSLTYLDINDDKQPEKLIYIELNLVKSDEKLVNIDKNLEIIDELLVKIEPNLDKQPEKLTRIDKNLDIIDEDLISIDLNLDKTESQMTDLYKNLDKRIEELSPINKNLDIIDEELITIDLNLNKQLSELTELIINLEKLDNNMYPLNINNEHNNLDVNTSLIINDSINDMSMNSLDIDNSKTEQNMLNAIIDNDRNEQVLNTINIEKNEYISQMSSIEQNSTPIINLMMNISLNDSKSNIDMIQTEYAIEKNDISNMYSINGSQVEEDFTDIELVKNLEKNTDMKMNNIKLNIEKIDDLVDIELIHNDVSEDMKLLDINNNDYVNGQQMSELIINDSTSNDMSMNDIDNSVQISLLNNMNSINKNNSKNDMNIIESKIKLVDSASVNNPARVMKSIISDKLINRITNLTSLDVDSLKTASVEDMNKLIGMMELTVKDVKTEMNMNEVNKNLDKKESMRSQMTQMVGYKHHNFGDDEIKVDANAFERGLTALKNAQERMKMNSLRDK